MQRRLSDYLQYEMYHVLGAYGVAERKLEELERRVRKAEPDADGQSPDYDADHENAVLQLARRAREYNAALGRWRHAADADIRHPIPAELPLSRHGRFDPKGDPDALERLRRNPWKGPVDWGWVPSFYETAVHVLSAPEVDLERDGPVDQATRLARNLFSRRDGLASGDEDTAQDRRRRLARYRQQLGDADEHLRPAQDDGGSRARRGGDRQRLLEQPLADLVDRVCTDNLSMDSDGSLPFFVIRVHQEAHLSMHAVEAWQSLPLGMHAAKVAGERGWLEDELDRCVTLGTFAYCVARSAPWIFAEDADECRHVFERFDDCWGNAVPTRCMWLAAQVSLLGLHRRAYARALRGNPARAYNDYHKLQRQIRDTRRRIQSAPVHVEGAHAFLTGLEAQAHHHIGELYRSEHAHKPAVKHFRSASHGLKQLESDERMKEVLVGSRWHVQLQVSQGKASYELGHHKESLCWHLRGWREFLRLLAADTGTAANVEEATKAIEWLTEVRYEPELLKSEIQEYIGPVVAQLDRIVVADHLGALAGDILLRLGHLLFVLNIGCDPEPPAEAFDAPGDDGPRERVAKEQAAKEQIAATLAFDCLLKAAQCDPRNTLAGADLLKARLRFRSWFAQPLPRAYDAALMPHELDEVASHWPGGSDDYENLARVTEYLMLRAQLHPEEPAADEPLRELARDLLMLFFMHTDSINVRKAQVHRFLMRGRREQRLPDSGRGPAIEFVCMRRYSSAFPLLPRPSTFRALGGGYFVRLHRKATRKAPAGKAAAPFGIVIDPGFDFIENLYRTGYSLSDIDMVVVTHDHVDHLGSLDPLLSLLHEHSEILKKQTRSRSGRPAKLVIYASPSVMARYEPVTRLRQANDFRDLTELVESGGIPRPITGWPPGFQLLPISSEWLDRGKPREERDRERGHPDLSKAPAYGICIRAPDDGPSIAIAGDTPSPPDPARGDERWKREWGPALEADLLVCHLSTVPLTELRQLAGIDATRQPLRRLDREQLHAAAAELQPSVERGRALLDEHPGHPFAEPLEQIRAGVTGIVEQTRRPGALLRPVDEQATSIQRAAEDIREHLENSESPPDLPREIYDLIYEARKLAARVAELPHDVDALSRARRELQVADLDLQGQIEFALWLRSHTPRGKDRETADLLRAVPEKWRPPPQHPYLSGLDRWARAYADRRQRTGRGGLLVIGELSEELGTVRSKVAMQLNEKVFSEPVWTETFRALTSDIGLHALITAAPPPEKGDGGRSPVDDEEPRDGSRVLCNICALDTDRVPIERFHRPSEIREVCVKGENEGIFYNCSEHNPARQREPAFLEQLERFDIFGR